MLDMIIVINEGQVHPLPAEIPFTVKCGMVWLTREGTGEDEIYRAGETIPAACQAGNALVQSLSSQAALAPENSRIVLGSPRPSSRSCA